LTRSRILSAFLDGLACAGLFLIMLFPAVTAVTKMGHGQSPSGLGAGAALGGAGGVVLHILFQGDSGGQMPAAAGLLRGILFLAATFWLLRPRRLDGRLRPGMLCALAFLLLALASALASHHLRDALTGWANYLAMLLGFILVADLARESRRLPLLHLGSLALLVAIIMVLPAAWFIFVLSPEPEVALFGSFYQPNMLAGYLLLGVPLASACFFFPEGQPREARIRSLLGGLFLAAFLVSLYYTYSRSAWAFALLGTLLPLALVPARGIGASFRRLLMAAVCLGGVGGGALLGLRGETPLAGGLLVLGLVAGGCLLAALPRVRLILPWMVLVGLLALGLAWSLSKSQTLVAPHAVERAGQLASGQDNSGAARVEFYRAAWRMALRNPWLGVGPEGFQRYYPSLQADLRWFAKYAHSLTLTLLAETGFPATAFFYLAVLSWAWVGWRRSSCPEPPSDLPYSGRTLRFGLGLGVLVFLGHAQFDVDFTFLALPLSAALMAGLAVGFPAAGEDVEEPPPRPVSQWSIRPGLALQYLASLLLLGLVWVGARWGLGDYLAGQARLAGDAHRDEIALDLYRAASRWDPLQGEHERQATLIMLEAMLGEGAAPEVAREALQRSTRAVELDPHRAVSHSAQGRVLEALGRFQEAEASYRRALEIDPVNFPSFYLDVARMMAQSRDLEGARKFLQQALELYPTEAFAVMFNFRSAALDQQLAEVHLHLALMYPVGAPERLENLEKAWGLDPTSSQVRFALATERFQEGLRLEAAGDDEKARPLFEEVTRVMLELSRTDPGFVPLQNFLRELRRRGFGVPSPSSKKAHP